MRAPVNQAAIRMIVVENSIMKTFLKLTAVLGLAALMVPLSVNAQEQKHEQGKGAPAGRPAPAARAAPPQSHAAPQRQTAPPHHQAPPQPQPPPPHQPAP